MKLESLFILVSSLKLKETKKKILSNIKGSICYIQNGKWFSKLSDQ